jgi:hypothetical protein
MLLKQDRHGAKLIRQPWHGTFSSLCLLQRVVGCYSCCQPLTGERTDRQAGEMKRDGG